MITITSIFVLSLVICLVLTPLAARLGHVCGAIDYPNNRKVHERPRPRSGGVAIVGTFFIVLGITMIHSPWGALFTWQSTYPWIALGSLLTFSAGFIDDCLKLHYSIKFGIQILAVSLAFFGGLQFDHFYLAGLFLDINPLISYLLTLFWFLLFINAINLIDGLDGLATGIVFFASLIMVMLLAWRGDIRNASLFAAIAGICLGFLRYNFHPATIFLGDGGSYFLGYIMAALAIEVESKSQLSAALLIPVVGLGVPIIDTMLSPIRRFARGRGLFHPDSDHIHHLLLRKGLSTQQTVGALYLITLGLCLFSLLVAQIRDPRGGLLLVIFGVAVLFFLTKASYFSYLKGSDFGSWIKDVSYEAGILSDRRTFLDLQIQILESRDLHTLWTNIIKALDIFEFDLGELIITNQCLTDKSSQNLIWTRNNVPYEQLIDERGMMKIELPLINRKGKHLGILWLLMKMEGHAMSHYTLRRVEHLRRSVSKALEKIGG
jgi:UDP-GlcNAc:undecaprenyl-phosphate GlcNAc-1-phosphate transferase